MGSTGKWLATGANFLILYGLLTAYIGGGTSIIVSALSTTAVSSSLLTLIVTLILFVALSAFTAAGTGFVVRYNQFLMLFLGSYFVALVIMGSGHIEFKNMLDHDIRFLPIAVPVILCAFHFHNIIPTICKDMEWDIKAISRAMLLGMGIGFIMNFVWVAVSIGVLPLAVSADSIVSSFRNGMPATVPIGHILANPYFSGVAIAFSLTAICTSYAANGIGLMDFNRDLLGGGSKIKIIAATFLPPLFIALLFPTIFLKAIGIVGGVGIALLFGVLPAVIFYIKSKSLSAKTVAVCVGLLFASAMVIDLADDFGVINTDNLLRQIQQEHQTK